ncbi:MAG TPA: hypothetical protein PLK90_08005 [Clostridiales bacterium]|nr:hypothetical protein [Clostridiales bacterium]HQP70327.1 hypothetical protein [Clostridiales bacterium]
METKDESYILRNVNGIIVPDIIHEGSTSVTYLIPPVRVDLKEAI